MRDGLTVGVGLLVRRGGLAVRLGLSVRDGLAVGIGLLVRRGGLAVRLGLSVRDGLAVGIGLLVRRGGLAVRLGLSVRDGLAVGIGLLVRRGGLAVRLGLSVRDGLAVGIGLLVRRGGLAVSPWPFSARWTRSRYWSARAPRWSSGSPWPLGARWTRSRYWSARAPRWSSGSPWPLGARWTRSRYWPTRAPRWSSGSPWTTRMSRSHSWSSPWNVSITVANTGSMSATPMLASRTSASISHRYATPTPIVIALTSSAAYAIIAHTALSRIRPVITTLTVAITAAALVIAIIPSISWTAWSFF